jgi:putative transposase
VPQGRQEQSTQARVAEPRVAVDFGAKQHGSQARVPVPPREDKAMTFYRRNLPHWQPEKESVFLTWRLYDSWPRGTGTPACEPSAGRQFVQVDRILDAAASGPLWLKDPRIAEDVVAAIHRGAATLKQYKLHAYVVMANHVHMLITPAVALARITKGLKGVTARAANRILARIGKPFWLDESYDHWVRNEKEFDRIVSYIENNPLAAGLVARAEDWPWSSARRQQRTQAGVPVPRGKKKRESQRLSLEQ